MNPLDCVRIYTVHSSEVDQVTRKLLNQLNELEKQVWQANRKIDSIKTALELAGVKPTFKLRRARDADYAKKEPFKALGLKESCLYVLRLDRDYWFTRSEIEYCLARGGYEFSAKDAKNSVDVTMRRIADEGLCEVERVRGPSGNRYKHKGVDKTQRPED